MTDEKLAMSMTVEDFLTYVEETKSKHTYKEYKIGLEKFSKFFGKSRNEILEMRRPDWVSGNLHQKKRFTREIEKFHAWLKKPIHTIKGKPNQAYSINSAHLLKAKKFSAGSCLKLGGTRYFPADTSKHFS